MTDYLAIARDASRRPIDTPSITGGSLSAEAAKIDTTNAQAVWCAAVDLLEGDPLFSSEMIAAMREAEAQWESAPVQADTTLRCDRCGFLAVIDVPIHDGQSTRRECARCHRFRGFPKWYGQNRASQVKSDKELNHGN